MPMGLCARVVPRTQASHHACKHAAGPRMTRALGISQWLAHCVQHPRPTCASRACSSSALPASPSRAIALQSSAPCRCWALDDARRRRRRTHAAVSTMPSGAPCRAHMDNLACIRSSARPVSSRGSRSRHMLIRSARARDMLGGMLMVSDMPVAGGRQGLARGASPDTAQTAVRNFPCFPPPRRSAHQAKLRTQTRRDRGAMADNSPGTDWYDW